jgi:CHAT domain-containing protein
VSAGELVKRFRDEEEAALAGNARMPIESAAEYYSRFEVLDPATRPFEHPYYWGAFTFSGA